MKKLCLFALLFSFIVVYSNDSKSILNQLNKNWGSVPISSSEIPELKLFSEIELIQFHLNYVIDSLKRVNSSHLNPQTKSKRDILLNELSKYSKAGVFPKNLYHQKRTPYFIDDFGTACAVGQLIIKSGHRDLAESIAETKNYSYIEDMPQTEIINWANEFGFTVDELKWIQPLYGPSCPRGSVVDACDSSRCGCLHPDTRLWPSNAASYTVEYNDGSGWVVDSNLFWYYYCARIGDHRFTVLDSNNNTHIYNYNIGVIDYDVDTIVTQSNYTNSCTYTIKSRTNNLYPKLAFQLWDTLSNYIDGDSLYFDSLCAGIYRLRITDLIYSCSSRWVTINVPPIINNTEILSLTNFDWKVYPNPFENEINISSSIPYNRIQIWNSKGQIILEDYNYKTDSKFNTNDLKSGIYFIQLNNSLTSAPLIKKVIKY